MTNIKFHLLEIKLRFFYLIFSTILTFFISYNYQLEMIYITGKPFIELQQTFIFLELTEALYTLIKISTIITILVVVPFFVYQIWSFFIPSFYKMKRNLLIFFLFFSIFLFISEILFTYFILLPKICHFLISFEMTSEIPNSKFYTEPLISVEFTARIGSYVKLIVKFLSLILVILQIPLCVCFLYSKKVLHVSNFYFNRKILGLVSLLLSAFIVPPDLFSQLILTVCFFILFEIIIFIGLFF